jgi:hypothetical protein
VACAPQPSSPATCSTLTLQSCSCWRGKPSTRSPSYRCVCAEQKGSYSHAGLFATGLKIRQDTQALQLPDAANTLTQPLLATLQPVCAGACAAAEQPGRVQGRRPKPRQRGASGAAGAQHSCRARGAAGRPCAARAISCTCCGSQRAPWCGCHRTGRRLTRYNRGRSLLWSPCRQQPSCRSASAGTHARQHTLVLLFRTADANACVPVQETSG